MQNIWLHLDSSISDKIFTSFLQIHKLYLLKYSKRFFLNEYKNPLNEKSWAMVTGASDGIGAEYCRILAL